MGGKRGLIKISSSSNPYVHHRLFKLPTGVIHDLNRTLASFWWGSPQKGRKIYWRKWETLCKPKWSGRLGFRDFEVFNQAMLAKQA